MPCLRENGNPLRPRLMTSVAALALAGVIVALPLSLSDPLTGDLSVRAWADDDGGDDHDGGGSDDHDSGGSDDHGDDDHDSGDSGSDDHDGGFDDGNDDRGSHDDGNDDDYDGGGDYDDDHGGNDRQDDMNEAAGFDNDAHETGDDGQADDGVEAGQSGSGSTESGIVGSDDLMLGDGTVELDAQDEASALQGGW
ncbi:MAG: hypothetical protein KDG54_11155 [Geminicoccaceae bacterium]|nr:hypothetical protein [Geminicoccaceae bacterium]